ncbi:hypothetical protein GCM10027174_41600 [Salinifilum aidingensis]
MFGLTVTFRQDTAPAAVRGRAPAGAGAGARPRTVPAPGGTAARSGAPDGSGGAHPTGLAAGLAHAAGAPRRLSPRRQRPRRGSAPAGPSAAALPLGPEHPAGRGGHRERPRPSARAPGTCTCCVHPHIRRRRSLEGINSPAVFIPSMDERDHGK